MDSLLVYAGAGLLVAVGCLLVFLEAVTVVSVTSGFDDTSPLTVVLALVVATVLWVLWATAGTAFED